MQVCPHSASKGSRNPEPLFWTITLPVYKVMKTSTPLTRADQTVGGDGASDCSGLAWRDYFKVRSNFFWNHVDREWPD